MARAKGAKAGCRRGDAGRANLGRARESWLRSEDTDKFVEAQMACRHGAGFCAQDGYCHYGDCFYDQRQARVAEEQVAVIKNAFGEINRAMYVMTIEQKKHFFRQHMDDLQAIAGRIAELSAQHYRRRKK